MLIRSLALLKAAAGPPRLRSPRLVPTIARSLQCHRLVSTQSPRLSSEAPTDPPESPQPDHDPVSTSSQADRPPLRRGRTNRQLSGLPQAALARKATNLEKRRLLRWLSFSDPRFRTEFQDVWSPQHRPAEAATTTTSKSISNTDDPVALASILPVDRYRVKNLYKLLRSEPSLEIVWGFYKKVTKHPNSRRLLPPRFYEWFAQVLNYELNDPERSAGVMQLGEDLLQCHNQRFTSDQFLASYIASLYIKGHPRRALQTLEQQLALTDTERGFRITIRLMNYYLRALLETGQLDAAVKLYDRLQDHPDHPADEFTASFMIRGLATLGMKEQAIECYHRFTQNFSGFADILGFNFILSTFAHLHAYDMVQTVLRDMSARDVGFDDATLTILLGIVGKDNSTDGLPPAFMRGVYATLTDARVQMDRPLIEAFVKAFVGVHDYDTAQRAYQTLKDRGFSPDRYFYETLTSRLFAQGHFAKGLNLYHDMVRCGIPPSEVAQAQVLNAYMRLDTGRAEEYLEMIRQGQLQPSVSLYNGLICGYARTGDMPAALRMYRSLVVVGPTPHPTLRPDLFTYLGLFQGFCNTGARRQRAAYGDFSRPHEATPTQYPNVFPANPTLRCTPLTGAARDRYTADASHPRQIYRELLAQAHIVPTLGLYASILRSFIVEGDLVGCERAYADMTGYFKLVPDDTTYSAMIFAFLRRADIGSAVDIFRTMRRNGVRPSTVLCNALIRGLSRADSVDRALEIFRWMTKPPSETHKLDMDRKPATVRPHRPTYASRRIGRFAIPKFNPFLDTDTHQRNNHAQGDEDGDGNPAYDPDAPDDNADADLTMGDFEPVAPDAHTYEAIVKGLVTSGRVPEAYECLRGMGAWGLQPNPSTISYLMKHHARVGEVVEATSLISHFTDAEVRQFRARHDSRNAVLDCFRHITPRAAEPLGRAVDGSAGEEFEIASLDVRFDRSQLGPTPNYQPVTEFLRSP
ncbi:hypothetical protein IWQ60_003975 [Tieghemiomyces parasiticus]|uniref:Pentacotripeptide-repeat region of PRORP domain-containing protein n=1 Tax=Tieghemiomyces parasiticus TaxID=78921 RepID=A0A9W8DZJ6_9FUNG|nr:hypothetical protein IWQ60_003975 [Tieghemiomyces parasiticus]